MPKLIELPVYSMVKNYSIIIPAHNEEKYIKKVLNAAILTSAEEIVVINDGSKDKTRKVVLELAKKYSKIKVINHKNNLGIISAYKSGINEAKNDILVFFDADIKNTKPWMFEKLIHPILKDKADLVIGSFDNFGRVTEFTLRPLLKIFLPPLARIKQPLSGLFAVKRGFLEPEKFITNQTYGLIQIFLFAYFQNARIKEVSLGKIIHDKRDDKEKTKQAFDEIKVFFTILNISNFNLKSLNYKIRSSNGGQILRI